MSSTAAFIVELVTNSISIIFCSIFISFYFISANLRNNHSMKFIFILQFFDLCNCFFSAVPFIKIFNHIEIVCKFQYFLREAFANGELIWILFISIYIFLRLYHGRPHDCISIKAAFIITTITTIPFSLAPALIDKKIGSNYYCEYGHRGYKNFFIFEFLFTYLLVFVLFFTSAILFCLIHLKFKKNLVYNDDPILKRLRIYLLIMLISYFPMFIIRCIQINGTVPEPILLIFVGIHNLLGVYNFIILGMTKEFKRILYFKVGREISLVDI